MLVHMQHFIYGLYDPVSSRNLSKQETKTVAKNDPKSNQNDDAADKDMVDKDGADKTRQLPSDGDYKKTSAEPVAADDDERIRVSQLKSDAADLNKRLRKIQADKAAAAAEESALVAQAAAKNSELIRLVGTPAKRPTTIVEYAKQEAAKGKKLVAMIIPKPFVLRLDDHTLIDVLAGVRRVPEEIADHWWFGANGATRADDDAA